MIISQEKILQRWDSITDILRDAIYSERNIQILDEIQEGNNFSDEQIEKLENLTQGVFVGLISIKDTYEYIQKELSVDARRALLIFQEIEEKVFNPVRMDIESIYKQAQKDGVIENTQEIRTEEKVVLKTITPNEQAQIINLKTQQPIKNPEPKHEAPFMIHAETPVSPAQAVNQNTQNNQLRQFQPQPAAQQPTQPRPIPIPQNQQNIRPQMMGGELSRVREQMFSGQPKNQETIQRPAQPPFGNQGAVPFGMKQGGGLYSPQQFTERSEPQQVNFVQQRPQQGPVPQDPMVLHKYGNIAPVTKTLGNKEYKNMSFGSFMGSFNAPGAQKNQQTVSRAEVQIGVSQKNIDTEGSVPLTVKKFEKPQSPQDVPQVVHYSAYSPQQNQNKE